MKVALYIRVSTNLQDTKMQKEELLSYCKYKKYENPAIFEDTSSGTNTNRKSFIKLMENLKEFDIVIVWKLSRLGRSSKDLLTTLDTFKKNKVAFVSIKENLDLSTKEGVLMMQMVGAFSEYEAEVIRENIKSGIASYMKEHGTWGRKPSIDQERVVLLFKKGYSQREIAEKLNTHKTTVRRILVRHGLTG